MKRKHGAPEQLGGTLLDPADGGIAVFHRKRERATHMRRTHTPILARRHPARMDEALGATADRAKQRRDLHLSGLWGRYAFIA